MSDTSNKTSERIIRCFCVLVCILITLFIIFPAIYIDPRTQQDSLDFKNKKLQNAAIDELFKKSQKATLKFPDGKEIKVCVPLSDDFFEGNVIIVKVAEQTD